VKAQGNITAGRGQEAARSERSGQESGRLATRCLVFLVPDHEGPEALVGIGALGHTHDLDKKVPRPRESSLGILLGVRGTDLDMLGSAARNYWCLEIARRGCRTHAALTIKQTLLDLDIFVRRLELDVELILSLQFLRGERTPFRLCFVARSDERGIGLGGQLLACGSEFVDTCGHLALHSLRAGIAKGPAQKLPSVTGPRVRSEEVA
jgi:hypothetical protein